VRAALLLEEDHLLDHRHAAAAVLLRPADAEPAVLADLPDELAVELAALHAAHGASPLRRHQLLEVAAEGPAELLLLGREIDVHGGLARPAGRGIPVARPRMEKKARFRERRSDRRSAAAPRGR